MLQDLSIGIDIIDINRFKKKPYKENKGFYKKIFQLSEINYCLQYKNPYPHFAGKFAIKESTIKALNKKISFLDIITGFNSSKPIVNLKIKNNYNFKVSLSHEKKYAVAVVLVESKSIK